MATNAVVSLLSTDLLNTNLKSAATQVKSTAPTQLVDFQDAQNFSTLRKEASSAVVKTTSAQSTSAQTTKTEVGLPLLSDLEEAVSKNKAISAYVKAGRTSDPNDMIQAIKEDMEVSKKEAVLIKAFSRVTSSVEKLVTAQ